MTNYIALLRGINVGGKNKILMADLRACLEAKGFTNVRTYIQSGNVLLLSELSAQQTAVTIETALVENFTLDSSRIKVLVVSREALRSIVANRPRGFGDQPSLFHSDVIFLLGMNVDDAMTVFNPRQGVDEVMPGNGVIYSERLSAERSKSRLNKIIRTKQYQSMTIRNWQTVTKLLAMTADGDKSEFSLE